ncbi:MAG: hypothetical protein KAR20_00785, partial [Candidatus Heimdallarchaeota archaeon]|nr:hypothetical protein [Candidatus Heimdallarchaeota archaeon]
MNSKTLPSQTQINYSMDKFNRIYSIKFIRKVALALLLIGLFLPRFTYEDTSWPGLVQEFFYYATHLSDYSTIWGYFIIYLFAIILLVFSVIKNRNDLSIISAILAFFYTMFHYIFLPNYYSDLGNYIVYPGVNAHMAFSVSLLLFGTVVFDEKQEQTAVFSDAMNQISLIIFILLLIGLVTPIATTYQVGISITELLKFMVLDGLPLLDMFYLFFSIYLVSLIFNLLGFIKKKMTYILISGIFALIYIGAIYLSIPVLRTLGGIDVHFNFFSFIPLLATILLLGSVYHFEPNLLPWRGGCYFKVIMPSESLGTKLETEKQESLVFKKTEQLL